MRALLVRLATGVARRLRQERAVPSQTAGDRARAGRPTPKLPHHEKNSNKATTTQSIHPSIYPQKGQSIPANSHMKGTIAGLLEGIVSPARLQGFAEYADKHEVFDVLEGLLVKVLQERPDDPVGHMISALKAKRGGARWAHQVADAS
jgi:hypothetical protein